MNNLPSQLFPAERPRKIYSVAQVNKIAKSTLENINVWVEGEIATVRKNPQYNFYYLDLKDESAVLPCIIDKSVLESLAGNTIGQKVLVYGFLSIYEPRGQYQLRIQYLESAGEGLLAVRLEETIRRLKAEGLFDIKYKKEIPEYPRTVCIVTSAGSDAWNDFRKHTVDKFPMIELYIANVRVQGPQSIPQLLKILPELDKKKFDVIVITRGGGSLEDLAAFNNEGVARMIFSMITPTIVAVGHEANESLAEWVADIRASTPTDAANIVSASYVKVSEKLFHNLKQLRSKYDYLVNINLQKLDYIYFQLRKIKISFGNLPYQLARFGESLKAHEKFLLADAKVKLGELLKKLEKNSRLLLDYNNQKLEELSHSLVLLSPENVLARGFAIATDSEGRIVTSIAPVKIGGIIQVKLVDGKLTSIVKSKEKNVERFAKS